MATSKYWLVSLWKVLTKPLPSTFEEITQDVADVFGGAITWIVIAVLLIFVPFDFYFGISSIGITLNAIFLIPTWFLFFTYLVYISSIFSFKSSRKNYERALFSIALIFILTTIVTVVLIWLYEFSILLNPFWFLLPLIYWLFLNIINVKGISKVTWLRSITQILFCFPASIILIILAGSVIMIFIGNMPHFL